MSTEAEGKPVDADASPEVEEPKVEADAEPKETETKGSAEESSPSPDESGDSSDKPKPKGVQKRLDELTRNWRETQRDRDYWRDFALRNAQPSPTQAPEGRQEAQKTLKDFNYDETQYQDHLFAKARQEAVQAAKAEASTWRQQEERVSLRRSWESRVADYAKDVDDFHEVFTDTTPVSEAMAEAIQASDQGPELAYYLGNHPDIATKLYNLPPIVAAREIGRIEANLDSERKKASGKTVSKTPPPTPKVEAKDAALKVSASDPDSDKLSSDDWFKRREKEISAKRR